VKLTDKYILGRFLKILGFALLAFVLVVIIVDIIENIDKFIDHDAPLQLIALYYIYYIPFIIILALPVATLLLSSFASNINRRVYYLDCRSIFLRFYNGTS